MELSLPRHRGTTLVEVVIAAGLMVTLSAAALSVFMQTQRAMALIERGGGDRDLSEGLTLMRRELSEAVAVTAQTATSLAIELPDRDADGSAESATYAWGGGGGDPLTRTDASGTATMVSSVDSLEFGLVERSHASTPTIQAVPTAFMLGGTPEPTGATAKVTVMATGGVALVTRPVLPTSTKRWTIIGFLVRMSRGSDGGGTTTVQLRTVSGGLPTATVLATVTLATVSLPGSMSWVVVPFPATTMPAGATEVAVVFSSPSLLGAAHVEQIHSMELPPNDSIYTGLLVTWLPASGSLNYQMFGTVTLPTSSSSSTHLPALTGTITSDDADATKRTELFVLPALPVKP